MTRAHVSELALPRLVLNRRGGGKVLSHLQIQLRNCDTFRFYVAFVNCAGVASLKQALLDAKDRGVSGRVLVSQYLNFSDPVALRHLLKLENLEVRIATRGSVHAKGFFFSYAAQERFIIGSSNWTAAALTTNTELNVHLETSTGSELSEEIREEFDLQFGCAIPIDGEYIDAYESEYAAARQSNLWEPRVPSGMNEVAALPSRA